MRNMPKSLKRQKNKTIRKKIPSWFYWLYLGYLIIPLTIFAYYLFFVNVHPGDLVTFQLKCFLIISSLLLDVSLNLIIVYPLFSLAAIIFIIVKKYQLRGLILPLISIIFAVLLYSSDILKPEIRPSTNERCTFPVGIGCATWLARSDTLDIKMHNTFGGEIVITSIQAVQNASLGKCIYISDIENQETIPNGKRVNFTLGCNPKLTKTGKYDILYITISYYFSKNPNKILTINGTISTRIEDQ